MTSSSSSTSKAFDRLICDVSRFRGFGIGGILKSFSSGTTGRGVRGVGFGPEFRTLGGLAGALGSGAEKWLTDGGASATSHDFDKFSVDFINNFDGVACRL